MQASAHFELYGTTRETLGWIALNARKNAALNPWAVYRDPLTMDDYLNARTITTPFGLYDCDVPCDGSVAIIVSRKDLAADMPQPAVHVEAVGTQITERVSWDQGTLDHEPLVTGPAAHLWTRTDLTTADIDMAQLYDGFTFNCLSWIEALGFCGWGEAKDFLDGGTNIAPRRDPPAEHARRAAVVGSPARLRLHPRSGDPAARAGRGASGGEGRDRRRQHRRRHPRRLLPVHRRAKRHAERAT